MSEGYIRNCVIRPRENHAGFLLNSETGEARLDGYAIIPVEEYERLKSAAGETPV